MKTSTTNYVYAYAATKDSGPPIIQHGMTLRDYYAGQVLASLADRKSERKDHIAKRCWELADEMLEWRDKTQS